MSSPELPNKPLVEAIFEMRWRLHRDPRDPNSLTDPQYDLLPGAIYERIKTSDSPLKAFTFHESLNQAMLPVELTPHTVHHRFRAGDNEWPLIQVGPGVYTVNETSTYKWEQFKPLCLSAIDLFKSIYPKPQDLHLQSLLLRYIDAIQITENDPQDFVSFLSERMHTTISLPAELFTGNIGETPTGVRSNISFPSKEPKGQFNLAISTGSKSKSPAIVLDTSIISAESEINPNLYEIDIEGWLEASHDLCTRAFRSFISGTLHERFSTDE